MVGTLGFLGSSGTTIRSRVARPLSDTKVPSRLVASIVPKITLAIFVIDLVEIASEPPQLD